MHLGSPRIRITRSEECGQHIKNTSIWVLDSFEKQKYSIYNQEMPETNQPILDWN